MASSFARVAVNVPQVEDLFDYRIREDLAGQMQLGSLVKVPFGQQYVQAIVVELLAETKVKSLKDIFELIDPQPVVLKSQIELARWLAEETAAPLSSCLRIMLPPGLPQMADTLYSLTNKKKEDDVSSKLQQRVIRLLQERGSLRGRQLQAAIPRQNWKVAVRTLIRNGLLAAQAVLPEPTVSRKTIRTAQIAQSTEVIRAQMDKVGRKGAAALPRRRAVLEFLMQEALPVNVSWVYAATNANAADLRYLEERDLIYLSETEIWRDPLAHIEVEPHRAPQLTSQQENAWRQMLPLLKKNHKQKPLVLHGITGSGKTELYLRAVEEVLKQGGQALVLVPEISLTPQTVMRFIGRFLGRVGLMHSRLSAGERYDTWLRARMGRIDVLVGPRSALFAPLPNLQLIVVDEFHDESFYQSEMQPYYHAVRTAIQYGALLDAAVILGSATPDVSLFYRAQTEKWPVIQLPQRILAHRAYLQKKQIVLKDQPLKAEQESETAFYLPLPLVQVVDMRTELQRGNRSVFSQVLQDALTEVLQRKQQAILFLNRRGTATYVFCRRCGNALECPQCETALTYHAQTKALMCHTCSYRRKLPERCPECGSTQIRQYGMGTQKVEELVLEQFPAARVLRWDADTVRRKGAEEILLSHFINHRADILIGTQMLAKGLDLPLVTLVGVVLADVGLNFPDFRSAERAFQVLMQVAGRAGRSPLGGRVILQTYQPQNYAIQAAASHDFDSFYQQEIKNRAALEQPPFVKLVRIEYKHHHYATAEKATRELADQLRQKYGSKIHMVGPTPAYFAKQRGYYRWQLILKGENPRQWLSDLPLGEFKIEVDPPQLL